MRALHRSHSFVGRLFAAFVVLLALGGCAALTARDPVRVSVVGIEPLVGQGLEMRFDVKLRLQNPNDAPIDYDGVALDLELNGRPFASGVSDVRGTVPRFGEQVLSVPVTVSAFAAARQAFGLADVTESGKLPYVLRGKLAGGMFGSVRFTDSGTLSLPASSGGYGRGY
ncbi:water stress/hypersensitive response domain-containing protein [Burkholderia savannae]|uniref:Water stress/hypersensitive response domain-containing protein n=1 Tax=Burkholderia savannae TaxID=1637837 RepID=A0ABR5TIB9_9BURK|nr:LEA type 2 family protein [Burkholderia savannae]KWZ44673.1 water stress/hypersensitive response domain-containing protein [Burkholderia savannae]